MEYKIFYSWQSDLPSDTNEKFIENAIENVVRRINHDMSLGVQLSLDRDIVNVPGAPDIASTILSKIDQSDIFICDVSIINSRQFKSNNKINGYRLTPNPNVLVELGYALKKLGSEKIILINNLAFGRQEDLPFDFRHKHVIGYNFSLDTSNKQSESELRVLEGYLEQKIRQILITLSKLDSLEPSLCDEAINSIEKSQPNQKIKTQKFFDWAMSELEKIAPEFPKLEGKEQDVLMKSIDQSIELISAFLRVFVTVIDVDSEDLLLWTYKTLFTRLIANYWIPLSFSGSFTLARMHFYQFVGHELFVSLIALLLERNKLGQIAAILDESLFVDHTYHSGPTGVSYTYISAAGESSKEVNSSLILSFADKLVQRHNSDVLEKLASTRQLIDADSFLQFRKGASRWYSISNAQLKEMPRFIVKASSQKYAENILKPLAIANLDEFRYLLSDWRRATLSSVSNGIPTWLIEFNPNEIASQK